MSATVLAIRPILLLLRVRLTFLVAQTFAPTRKNAGMSTSSLQIGRSSVDGTQLHGRDSNSFVHRSDVRDQHVDPLRLPFQLVKNRRVAQPPVPGPPALAHDDDFDGVFLGKS